MEYEHQRPTGSAEPVYSLTSSGLRHLWALTEAEYLTGEERGSLRLLLGELELARERGRGAGPDAMPV